MASCYCCGEEMGDKEYFDVWHQGKKVCEECNTKHVKEIMTELNDFGKIEYPYRHKLSTCAKCGVGLYGEGGYSFKYNVHLCLDC